jgi:hypothetical protein
MKLGSFIAAATATVAVLAPTAAFASSAAPNPVAIGDSVTLAWTNDVTACATFYEELARVPPELHYGTGVVWPSGTVEAFQTSKPNPFTVGPLPASVGTGTAHVFLATNPIDPAGSIVPGCEYTFEIVGALPSPMMSAKSLGVAAALAIVAVGSVMSSRRRRFAHYRTASRQPEGATS